MVRLPRVSMSSAGNGGGGSGAGSAGGTSGRRRGRRLITVLGVVLVVVLAGTAVSSSFTKTAGGEVAVVRNGGPLDDNRVRQVIQPASSLTWIGLYSSAHRYPAQQRFYTITSASSAGDRSGVDVEQVPTADGVEVGIEGTFYFTLSTDPAALASFDDKYGTRRYRDADGRFAYAWEDDAGWSSFLDQIVRPVLSNGLREEIGNVSCAQLVASCALVQNGGGGQAVSAVVGQGNLNIAKIQDAINTSLAKDLTNTLGGPFITGVRFNLVKITLPNQVQEAINQAQAAFAAVSEAQAKVQQAKAEAAANSQRQLGYQACPVCAQIDTMRAIPPNVTTFAPGAGFSVTAPAAPAKQ